MNSLAESLERSPELFPHALDVRGDTVQFIRLRRTDYESASFLDERILTPQTAASVVPWTEAAGAVRATRLSERCGYIFHIGHVGSTLVSRLVGAHRCAFSLREPLLLRTFAQMRGAPEPRVWSDVQFEDRLDVGLKLLSRTFDAQQTAIVKATSFVSELADELLARTAAPKAVLMFVSPESYMATLLGGENSRREAKILAPSRLQRLKRRVGGAVWNAETLSEGETLALAWACEMSGLAQAARAAEGRVLRLDFDRFLEEPPRLLLDVLHRFDIQATAAEVQAILAGPDMRRYSKAPEYAYDTALRRDVLNEARAVHAPEIRRGLRWLDRAAVRYPRVGDALAFAAAAAR